MYMPSVAMTPQELAWYAQQAQSHQQYPALVGAAMAAQLQQENNIRFQLYTQSQVYQQVQAQMAAQMHAAQRMQGSSSTSQQGSERPRTNSFDNPPLSAPIAGPQDWYSVYGVPMAAYYGWVRLSVIAGYRGRQFSRVSQGAPEVVGDARVGCFDFWKLIEVPVATRITFCYRTAGPRLSREQHTDEWKRKHRTTGERGSDPKLHSR
ncbi:hypothetical protein ColKHC_06158 [Colletotrichum higginsianum]|nr:hypothetical protein ColKHC_06158 [Colletotrichum higginsianum]